MDDTSYDFHKRNVRLVDNLKYKKEWQQTEPLGCGIYDCIHYTFLRNAGAVTTRSPEIGRTMV